MTKINREVFNILSVQHEDNLNNLSDDSRVEIEIDLDENVKYGLLLLAEVKGYTFNQFINKLLKEYICTTKSKK